MSADKARWLVCGDVVRDLTVGRVGCVVGMGYGGRLLLDDLGHRWFAGSDVLAACCTRTNGSGH